MKREDVEFLLRHVTKAVNGRAGDATYMIMDDYFNAVFLTVG